MSNSCHNKIMKILYLHPSVDLERAAYGIVPVGAFSLCHSLISAGHEIKILNIALELLLNPDFKLLPYLYQYNPDLVLLELHWYVHAKGAMKLAQLVKQWKPQVPVVSGGITASIFAHEIIKYPEFDFIISGDGEWSTVKLLEELEQANPNFSRVPNLWFSQDEISYSPQVFYAETTLDHLNFSSFQLLENWDIYMQVGKVPSMQYIPGRYPDFWLCNGRGCVFQCDFCGGGKFAQQSIYGRQSIVQRSVEKLSQDIDYLRQYSGVQQICLSYDLALMKKPYYMQLFQIWKDNKWELGLYNECWQLPTRSFVEAFADSVVLGQSALVFSPVSGSESVRLTNGKHFNNQKFVELLQLMATYQIPVQLFFNFNALNQDLDAFKETVELCHQISQFYPPVLITFYCQDVSPEPLSPRGERISHLTFKDYVQLNLEQLESEDPFKHEKSYLWQSFLKERQIMTEPLFQSYNHNIWKLS